MAVRWSCSSGASESTTSVGTGPRLRTVGRGFSQPRGVRIPYSPPPYAIHGTLRPAYCHRGSKSLGFVQNLKDSVPIWSWPLASTRSHGAARRGGGLARRQVSSRGSRCAVWESLAPRRKDKHADERSPEQPDEKAHATQVGRVPRLENKAGKWECADQPTSCVVGLQPADDCARPNQA